MRIATYNIWNDEETFSLREADILSELARCGADLAVLQEVPADFAAGALKELYPYFVFEPYEGEDAGLAILSRYPVPESELLPAADEQANCFALYARIAAGDAELAVMNVHLTWHSDAERLRHAERFAACLAEKQAAVKLLLGDFNCSPDAPAHRLLTQGNAPWRELCCEWAARCGQPLFATLDFETNPRWKNDPVRETPQNFDRIYLQGEAKLLSLSMFGTEVRPSGLCASDHYGICAELAI